MGRSARGADARKVPAAEVPAGEEPERLDKWIWHARIVRTRVLAQELVARGAVRVNRVRTTQPSRPVRPGDVLTIALPSRVLVLRVLATAERRGGAASARALYEDVAAGMPPEAGDRGD